MSAIIFVYGFFSTLTVTVMAVLVIGRLVQLHSAWGLLVVFIPLILGGGMALTDRASDWADDIGRRRRRS